MMEMEERVADDAPTARYKAVLFDMAARGIDEMIENLRRQVEQEATAIAREAQQPLLACYLSRRTAQLHEWATHLSSLRMLKDGWFRDATSDITRQREVEG